MGRRDFKALTDDIVERAKPTTTRVYGPPDDVTVWQSSETPLEEASREVSEQQDNPTIKPWKMAYDELEVRYEALQQDFYELRDSVRADEPLTNRRSLLNEAADLVDGDRNAQYGDPIQDFTRTATFWTEYLHGLGWYCDGEEIEVDRLLPHDVAVMMALLKISRITWDPKKRDSWADLAGYTACGWDCVEREGSEW